MKPVLAICVCITVISLMLTNIGDAKINLENIVGVWLFDEGNADIAHDATGNENHGKLINEPKWVEGEFGKALEFDGVDDYVFVDGSPSLDITDNITITAWAKHAAEVDILDKIFCYRRTGTSGGEAVYQLRFGPPNAEGKGKKLIFQTNTAAEGWKHAYSDSDVVTDTSWHHYAATASKGKVVLYLDGEAISTKGDVASEFDDGDQGYIGARVEKSDYFSGLLDEVAIFNVALDESDIKNIVAQGLSASALAVSPSDKLTTTWADIKTE